MSPDAVRGFVNADDTPLRSNAVGAQKEGTLLNFNNLVNESFEKQNQQHDRYYGAGEALAQATPRTEEFGSSNADHDRTF